MTAVEVTLPGSVLPCVCWCGEVVTGHEHGVRVPQSMVWQFREVLLEKCKAVSVAVMTLVSLHRGLS